MLMRMIILKAGLALTLSACDALPEKPSVHLSSPRKTDTVVSKSKTVSVQAFYFDGPINLEYNRFLVGASVFSDTLRCYYLLKLLGDHAWDGMSLGELAGV